MPLLKPDPTFYPSPRLAMQGPAEKLAFVAGLNPLAGTRIMTGNVKNATV